MKTLFSIDPWKLTETQLHRDEMRLSESLTSTGNAHMGARGNFEEKYSGDSHPGTYLAGVWFPDKTRVGWWKNGYPEYFGKVPNAPAILEIGVRVNGEEIDLARNEVAAFRRELDMEHGILSRAFTVRFAQGEAACETERFFSAARPEILAIRYRVTPSFDAEVCFTSAVDANVRNEDSNYGGTFWQPKGEGAEEEKSWILSQTKENEFGTPRFTVCCAFSCGGGEHGAAQGRAQRAVTKTVRAGETAELVKLVAVATSRDFAEDDELKAHTLDALVTAESAGYDALRREQADAWRARWDNMDVVIENDAAAQQGIRFNLFQLLSTYDGSDLRLNIGPKGFTGEKYGGATYWDTEMFCLPMVLSTLGQDAAKALLRYRFDQLPQAMANAKKLGCAGALYPMVTFTGDECHNEWEITFEEIHRNAAIFYAIWYYYTYTGDKDYLKQYGMPVMLEICRYWVSRVSWQPKRRKYMILGVTGPNEYENNVNNNWYTNRMAKFCLETFFDLVQYVTGAICVRDRGMDGPELLRFARVAKNLYLPERNDGLCEQQDGFFDKDLRDVSTLAPEERPLNQHWSWDRILRSCFIKQADVLQGMYCLRHLYPNDVIRRNFLYYEPMTVHESSLSPCVHAILAAQLGEEEKAVEMYARTARLDLDNINNDTEDGLHITSMCGSWMAIVKGFAGMRTERQELHIEPCAPEAFGPFSFRIMYQERLVQVSLRGDTCSLLLVSGSPLIMFFYEECVVLHKGKLVECKIPRGSGGEEEA